MSQMSIPGKGLEPSDTPQSTIQHHHETIHAFSSCAMLLAFNKETHFVTLKLTFQIVNQNSMIELYAFVGYQIVKTSTLTRQQ